MSDKSGRREEILQGLDVRGQTGIEIGPLDRPIIKGPDVNIRYADHASTQKLREKYAADKNVKTALIPEIDYVLTGNNLSECAGANSADFIVASHVIEHSPDFIGFIHDCCTTLKTRGVLCLAVPDCRFTFDVFRRPTFIEDVEIAHLNKATRPTIDQVIDHAKNVVNLDQGMAWNNRDKALQTATLKHLRANLPRLIQMHQSGEYLDVHCWVFTPRVFLALVRDVCIRYGIPLGLRHFSRPRYLKNEFIVHLVKLPDLAEVPATWATVDIAGADQLTDTRPAEKPGRSFTNLFKRIVD